MTICEEGHEGPNCSCDFCTAMKAALAADLSPARFYTLEDVARMATNAGGL